ncbi:hypothetical protein AB3662_07000 [Sorangium cellulosum]|uniref:phosphoribosyltransferase-like protein n=1 Tax=Sorangium cellulosum TaxID=56 RepID=UPI003D9A6746
MKQRLALRVLAELMEWSDDQAQAEFAWLKLMSRLKYDGYHGYLAGVRFTESLVTWLQQFDASDRPAAYRLVRERLVFVSTQEIRRLVERFYPREVEPRLVREAARRCGIPAYRVWADDRARQILARLRRQTLFIGLSDGARMDLLRRANIGVLSNEQSVLTPLIDHDKWRDLGEELCKDTLMGGVSKPRFNSVYVIDDLTASGTTLIRHDTEKSKWKGKLPRLRDAIWSARDKLKEDFPLAEDFSLCVHHYLATQTALDTAQRLNDQRKSTSGNDGWFSSVEFSTGCVLRDTVKLHSPDDHAALGLADRYYDPVLETRHTEESGVKDMHLGYGECALTLVLEHNTPNNSLPLLWAETQGEGGAHPMRPLFRRRSRHV